MPRHGGKVRERYIVAVDDHDPQRGYQTYLCENFEQAYESTVRILANFPDVTIDVFLDKISPDTYQMFAWRSADSVFIEGKGPGAELVSAQIKLSNQESSVTDGHS